MKFHLILTSLLLSSLALAQTAPPYTLEIISNSDFVNVTLDQIASKVGDQAKFIGAYECDGVKENALFPEYAFSNGASHSLTIQIGEDDNVEIFTYKQGVLTDAGGNPIKRFRDSFLSKTMNTLTQLEALPTGKVLLDRLEHSPYPLKIVKGQNRFIARGTNGLTTGIWQASTAMFFKTLFYPESYNGITQIGNGGDINFDPDGKYSRIESDDVVRLSTAPVALAHEMFHAYDSVRGLLDRRFVNGKEYQSTEACEYRAVYMENQIRKELGIRYAKYYSTTNLDEARGQPGVLSPTGEPYFIPSACIEK